MGHSAYFFRMPSFLNGAARVIDLFGDFDEYARSDSPEEADVTAFYHDIAALREDAQTAFELAKRAYDDPEFGK